MPDKLERKVVHKKADGASDFLKLVAKEAAALLFTEQEFDWDVRISTALKCAGKLYAYVKVYTLTDEKTLRITYRMGNWERSFHYSKRNWPYLNEVMMQELQKLCKHNLRRFLAAVR